MLLLRRQDLRRVKPGGIDRLILPDVQKDILESLRQAHQQALLRPAPPLVAAAACSNRLSAAAWAVTPIRTDPHDALNPPALRKREFFRREPMRTDSCCDTVHPASTVDSQANVYSRSCD